jgi:hypothetical protein
MKWMKKSLASYTPLDKNSTVVMNIKPPKKKHDPSVKKTTFLPQKQTSAM